MSLLQTFILLAEAMSMVMANFKDSVWRRELNVSVKCFYYISPLKKKQQKQLEFSWNLTKIMLIFSQILNI